MISTIIFLLTTCYAISIPATGALVLKPGSHLRLGRPTAKVLGRYRLGAGKITSSSMTELFPENITPVLKNVGQLKASENYEKALQLLNDNLLMYKFNLNAMNLYSKKFDQMTPMELVDTDLNGVYAKFKDRARKNLNVIKNLAAIDKEGIKRANRESALVNAFGVDDIKQILEKFKPKTIGDVKHDDLLFDPIILDIEKERAALESQYSSLGNTAKFYKARLIDRVKQD